MPALDSRRPGIAVTILRTAGRQMHRAASLSIVIVAALTLVVGGSGCGGKTVLGHGDSTDDLRLLALRAQPIASLVPDGAVLENEWQFEEHTALGKSIRAAIHRVFRFESASAADAGRDQAFAFADSDGWHLRSSLTRPDDLRLGRKQLETGAVSLAISRYTSSGRPLVSIQIGY